MTFALRSSLALISVLSTLCPQHASGSAHYDNRALDFRGNNISDQQGEQWAERVRERLGPNYAVDFERFPDNPARDHLHVARRRG